MSTYGDSIREQRIGEGMPAMPTVPSITAVYPEFSAGLIRSVPPESLPPNAASYAVDMEVGPDGALKIAPGIEQITDATPHSLRWVFEHSNIDPESRLIAIAPPFVGVKGDGDFEWTNHGISAMAPDWTAVSAVGEMLFSNGRAAYHRTFDGTITEITDEITARAFGSAFGRLFAGAYWADGREQSLGIRWNTAQNENALTNWSTDGAGGEFLLSDEGQPDRVVAIRALGMDVMGILNRHSLWAGYPTGVANRPADFRVRFKGIGCVSERTVAATPWGLVFLSDDGVALYDINQVSVISHAINPDLLPLDEENLGAYSGAYDPHGQRYLLSAPGGTWVYEFAQPGRPARWFFRSAVVDGVWYFSVKASGVSREPQLYFAKGSLLGIESKTAENFGTDLTPIWRTPELSRGHDDTHFCTTGIEITYSAKETDQFFVLHLQNVDQTYQSVEAFGLPATGGGTNLARMALTFVGIGVSMEIRPSIESTDLCIRHMRQFVQPAGRTRLSRAGRVKIIGGHWTL